MERLVWLDMRLVGFTGQPRIVDIVVEGTSLRLVKRSECESFLLRHDGSVDLLIQALRDRRQASVQGDL